MNELVSWIYCILQNASTFLDMGLYSMHKNLIFEIYSFLANKESFKNSKQTNKGPWVNSILSTISSSVHQSWKFVTLSNYSVKSILWNILRSRWIIKTMKFCINLCAAVIKACNNVIITSWLVVSDIWTPLCSFISGHHLLIHKVFKMILNEMYHKV